MIRHPLFHHLNQLASERWAWQGVRLMVRAAWISLCLWCIGVGATMLFGWPVQIEWLGATALLVIGGALLVLLLRNRMSPLAVARRLDRRFNLHEQLATAVEVAAHQPNADSVGAQLLDQATQTMRQVRRRVRQRQAGPWSDILTLLALGLVALGLFFLSGIGRPQAFAEAPPLPPLVGLQDPAQPEDPEAAAQDPSQVVIPSDGEGGVTDPSQMGLDEPGVRRPGAANQPGAGGQGQNGQQQGAGQGSNQAPITPEQQQALDTIADALRDQGLTRPAAEALDQGDTSAAAQELRELADQADQISRDARESMADSLRDAASQLDQTSPELAQQLRESARGLERGDEYAAEALDDLARALEQPNGPQSQEGMPLPGEPELPGEGGEGQPSDQQGNQPGQASQPGQDSGNGESDSQGQGGGAGNVGAGEQRPVQSPGRLGVEGQSVPLDVEGPGQNPGGPTNQATVASGGAIGSVSGGGGGNNDGVNGPDPLRIPLDERDVVQDYFTP